MRGINKNIKISKRVLTVVLAISIAFFGNSISFASMRSSTLSYVGEFNQQFQKNIKNMSKLDTNVGGSWKIKIDNKAAATADEIQRFYGAIFAVVPFFNSIEVQQNTKNLEISLKNNSKYENEKVVAVALKWLNESVKPGMSTKEKIKAIHDKIISEVSYDQTYQKESHSPGAAAFTKKAVCDGYSRMFAIMANLAEIPVLQVTSKAMNHGFNLVFEGGDWKIVDVTYDDPISKSGNVIRYDYFLINKNGNGTHIYDTKEKGLTLSDYIEIGNYVYAGKLK